MNIDKPYFKVATKLLSHSAKDKPIFIKFDGKWYKGVACQTKSRSGVRFNRFIRLIRLIHTINSKRLK